MSLPGTSLSNSHHNVSLTSASRPGSSQESESARLTQFENFTLPLLESPASSQLSLSLKPRANELQLAPRLKENKAAGLTSAERGRNISRAPLNRARARSTFRSPISPDRFIPKREFGESSSTPFRVNKHPQQLSPGERLLRRRLPGDDPFLPTPRRSPAFPGQRSTPTRLRQRPPQRPHLVTDSSVVGSNGRSDFLRQVSSGAVWGVGGASAMLGDSSVASSSPSQSLVGRGTTASAFVATFLPRDTAAERQNKHESRLALALDIDRTTRLLGTCTASPDATPSPTSSHYEWFSPFVWKDSAWKKVERENWPSHDARPEVVPPKPFRILDAPYLRDDFYCSTLAYSSTAGILAVGLAHNVYLWSEGFAVDHPPFEDVHPSNYVTSLSFSSEDGKRSILAVGRQSGQLSLWSVFESKVRFEISHPISISCVSFRPKTSQRLSQGFANTEVEAEDLVVGDDMGDVWYYSVEWPVLHNKWSWTGSMTLLAKICAHTQQVCGIAWSPDDRFLATGGNDNACMLFELCDVLPGPPMDHSSLTRTSADSSGLSSIRAFPCLTMGTNPRAMLSRQQIVNHLLPSWVQPLPVRSSVAAPLLSHMGCLLSGNGQTVLVPSNRQKHRLVHSAAVKAIAFAPWQPSLLATGGGSNDRAIHFFHARTGVCLATINVFAQVTSLIWSQTRREIAATFGYAQPEHPFRIAVFSWPSCSQVAVIPWGPYGTSWDGHDQEISHDCGRALWAVSYPGRPPRSPPLRIEEPDLVYASPSPPSLLHPTRSRSPARGNRPHRHKRRAGLVRPKEKEGGMWCRRTLEEGCIIVASSDQTVKFHEVWTGRRKSTGVACGLLGGSDILEGIEGIEKSGSEVIR
ncbi:uncharacterized protein N7459_005333 [Penicillium hispanicum]|uniref:uncharacterized protein n=1 Tax=Penicillium hispanicum TaxID=1080232 RepID=UPI002541E93B|nr:uncharacterized protein N7459_005333 [Penicillium hispanicum]KAJ5585533.1 hypothetical protein N7459_005333 [Penicillium hispanicum]